MSKVTTLPEKMSNEGPMIVLDINFAQSLHELANRAVDLLSKGSAGYQVEFEFRLGRINSLNHRSHQWNFDSTIAQAQFDHLKENMSKSSVGSSVRHSISVVSSKTSPDGSRIRKIEQSTPESSIIYQRKTAIKHADQLFLSVPISDPAALRAVQAGLEDSTHMLRFALSTEEESGDGGSSRKSSLKTQFDQMSGPVKARNRERWSYQFDKFGIIDLTIVDGKECSVEFEFNQSEIANWKNIQDRRTLFSARLFPSLKYISRLIWPELNLLNGINGITETYFKLLNISTAGASLTALRPQNIAENEVPNIVSDYSFTNKLNGTYYRLLIDRFKYSSTWHVSTWLISDSDLRFIGILPNELSHLLGFSADLGKDEKPHGSLLDVELFLPTRGSDRRTEVPPQEIHVIDSPVFRGINKTLLPHSERLDVWKTEREGGIGSMLSNFLFSLGYLFEIKHFFDSPNPFASLQDSVRFMYSRYGLDSEKDNDGIIMQPTKKAYYDRSAPIYKWKWPSTVTIDFQLDETAGFSRDGIEYKVFQLFLLDKSHLTLFRSFNRGGKFFNPPSVILFHSDDSRLNLLHNGVIAELGFNRLENSFILFRIRDDKTEPNQLNTGQATFVDMYVEFTLDRLSSLLRQAMENKGKGKLLLKGPARLSNPADVNGKSEGLKGKGPARLLNPVKSNEASEGLKGQALPLAGVPLKEPTLCLENYRTYHNRIKTGLIQNYCTGKRVLDAGSGLGGDLWKFYHAKTSYLWAVEPNLEFIEGPEGFKERLQKVAAQRQGKEWARHVEVINSGIEETKQISEYMIASKDNKLVSSDLAEIVTAFFSLSFLFQSPSELEGLARTISDRLEIDGLFIGVMIDGTRLYDALQAGNIIDPCYHISRKFDPSMPLGLGLQIGIQLNTATVLDEQLEWISPFDALKKVLKAYNVKLIESSFLDDINNVRKFKRPDSKFPETEELYARLNKSEKLLNSFYRYFVFQKESQLPEQILIPKQRNELHMLSLDEAEPFRILNYPEPLDRVGVIGEGSCFFHSLLFLMINEKYLGMRIQERKSLARKFRNALADALSPEIFSSLAGGSVEVIGYTKYVQEALKEALITNVEKEGETPGITEKELDKLISRASVSASITEQIKAMEDGLAEFGYDHEVSSEIIQHGRLLFWKDYKSKLKDCKSYADHDSIEYVMRTIKRNIFIIEDETRLPVLFAACDLYDPKLPSLVVILLQNIQHYEPVSSVETDAEGNVVRTTLSWSWNSPLIQSFYHDLCQKQSNK
jgi:hypothetical protein